MKRLHKLFEQFEVDIYNIGENESLIKVSSSFSPDISLCQYLANKFGTDFTVKEIDSKYKIYVPVGHRDDEEIESVLSYLEKVNA